MDMMQVKLPEAVTDNTLKTLDEIEFFVSGNWDSTATNNRIVLKTTSGESSVVRIVDGDAHFTDSTNTQNLGKSITVPGDTLTSIYISSGSAKILISNKEHIRTINYPTGRNTVLTDDVNFLSPIRLNYTSMINCYFENPLDVDKYSALIELRVNNPQNQISFNLSDIKVYSVLQLLGSNVVVHGSISDLSQNKNLSEIRLKESTGAAEDLFDGMFNGGRTSGSLLMIFSGGTVTYQGSAIRGITAAFSSEGWTVSSVTPA
jgi:hypothetical protein